MIKKTWFKIGVTIALLSGITYFISRDKEEVTPEQESELDVRPINVEC